MTAIASKKLRSKKKGPHIVFADDHLKATALKPVMEDLAFALEKIYLIDDQAIVGCRDKLVRVVVDHYANSVASRVTDVFNLDEYEDGDFLEPKVLSPSAAKPVKRPRDAAIDTFIYGRDGDDDDEPGPLAWTGDVSGGRMQDCGKSSKLVDQKSSKTEVVITEEGMHDRPLVSLDKEEFLRQHPKPPSFFEELKKKIVASKIKPYGKERKKVTSNDIDFDVHVPYFANREEDTTTKKKEAKTVAKKKKRRKVLKPKVEVKKVEVKKAVKKVAASRKKKTSRKKKKTSRRASDKR